MRTSSRLAACAFAAAALIPAIASAAAPDPYGIYAKSRTYWVQQHYPATIDYRVAISATENGVERTERYDSVYDAVSNAISVDPISDFERAHAPTPDSGLNYSFGPYRLVKPSDPGDIIGVPRLAPNFSFGMAPFVPASSVSLESDSLVDQVRREFGDLAPSQNSLRVIGTVTTASAYHISFLGTSFINGHDCYHLSFNPERDANRFRIREAWIDRSTFAPWRLIDATNFRSGLATTSAWSIDFADVNGAHYIAQERSLSPLVNDDHRYSSVAVTFENIHERRGPFPFEAIAPSEYTSLTEPQ